MNIIKNKEGFEMNLNEGLMKITREEFEIYSLFFKIVDSDGDQAIAGKEGACFLRRSGLEEDALSIIWRLASGVISKSKLHLEEWIIACMLVALAQEGLQVSRTILFNENRKVNIACFQFGTLEPQYIEKPLPLNSICLRITNAVIVGRSFKRHVVYTLSTRTTLSHFPRKSAIVTRRYSHFVWLHKRLSKQLPNVVLPPLPSGKWWGNLDAEFIEERRVFLEIYLNHIIRHPQLSTLLETVTMIDASVEGFEGLIGMLESGQDTRVSISESEAVQSSDFDITSATFSSANSSASPRDGFEWLIFPIEDVDQIRRKLRLVKKACKSVIDASEKLLIATEQSNRYQLETLRAAKVVMDKLDTKLASGLDREIDNIQTMVAQKQETIRTNFLLPLKFLLGRVRLVLQQIQSHDKVLTSFHAAYTSYARHSDEAQLARLHSRKQTLGKLNSELGDQVRYFQSEYNAHSRSLMESLLQVLAQSGCQLGDIFAGLSRLFADGDPELEKQSREKVTASIDESERRIPLWLAHQEETSRQAPSLSQGGIDL